MNDTCINSTVSLRYRAPVSFSFNDCSACLNNGFDRNPFLFSSSVSSSSCCSCCCANSLYYGGPITSPSCMFGLRQSNLIQWSTHKSLVLNGLDRCSYDRYPACDVDLRPLCEKDYIFKEGIVGGKGRKIGTGRFTRMVYEEKIEWDGSDVRANEIEIMLSLLNGDVDDECNNVGEEGGQSHRNIEVVKGGNKSNNSFRKRKKNVDSGVLESLSEFQYESEMIGLKDGEMRRKEKNKTEKETGVLSGRENVKVKREDDWANCRQEVVVGKAREEERMDLLRDNQRERSEVEEGENLLRIKDHRQRVRKDGSSCSSYYSLTSDDFEIHNEMQHEQDENEEGISGSYMRDSKKREAIASHEGKEEFQGHGNYSREPGFTSRKENAQVGFSGASSSLEYDWRKKSEKKLSDLSFQGTTSSEEAAQQHSSHRQVDSRKTVGASSNFDDKKKQWASTVNFDEEIGQRNDQKIQSKTRMKSKESRGRFVTHDSDAKTYSTTGKLYTDRDGSYYKSQNSVQNKSDYFNASDKINKEENYRKSSGEATKTLQEVDIRGTSTAVRQSGIKISQEDHVKTAVSSSHNSEEQRHQSSEASEQLAVRNKYINVSEKVDSERTSLLRREDDVRMKKQEMGSSSSYGSYYRVRDQRSEMTRKHITTEESRSASQDTIDLSRTPYSNTEGSVLGDDGKWTGEIEPLSQMAGRGSSTNRSAHVSATVVAALDNLHGSSSESHTLDKSQGFHYESSHDSTRDDSGQPSKSSYDEDRLASADQLQKSSSHFVGEFVQKVRNEISSSELYEMKTYETKITQQDEPLNRSSLSSHGSKIPEPKEQKSKSSSHSSEAKGPSDKSWDVDEPSTGEAPKAEEIGNGSTSGKGNVRRTGKSLWRMIGDMVLLRWSRSEIQSLAAQSGGKNSPNQSTSSDTWFSGHEPEETIDLSTKSDRISFVEESTSTDYRQEGLISYVSQGEVFNASNTQGDLKHRGAGSMDLSVVSEKDSSLKNISLPSAGAISTLKESSLLLPSPDASVSPVVQREGEGSSSGTSSQIEQPFPTNEKSRTDGNNAEVKRRKFGRADQVSKDKFDEWEEAYRLETELRRIDEMFMREALLEAKKAADSWEVPVGAVLVRDGRIIARGFNLVEEIRDSTAHAEIICIREASNVLRTWRLSDTTLYVTLEPCPMCAGAILQARIDTVVWGTPNKLLGADGSWIRLFPNGEGGNEVEQADKPAPPVHPFHPKIAVRRRVLEAECADTMQQFFQLRRRKDKKREEEPKMPPSCLPITHHPSKFLNKMHHAFHGVFCL